MTDTPTPREAFEAVEACRRHCVASGRAGRITLHVDQAAGRQPKWRVVLDGKVWAAYDPDLVGIELPS